mmetsp:Transcript_10346/g.30008  ORF Transcript_10346/g.30008 Transcript_10346/m.30008 type:complete len:222 (+) Transcript_10346:847-1512(+)
MCCVPCRDLHAERHEGAVHDPQRRRGWPAGDCHPSSPRDRGHDRHRARQAQVLGQPGPFLQDVVLAGAIPRHDRLVALPLLRPRMDNGGGLGGPIAHARRADLLPLRLAEVGERQFGRRPSLGKGRVGDRAAELLRRVRLPRAGRRGGRPAMPNGPLRMPRLRRPCPSPHQLQVVLPALWRRVARCAARAVHSRGPPWQGEHRLANNALGLVCVGIFLTVG